MSNYHYLGSAGRSGINLGAFIGDKLVVGAIFAHPVRKEVSTSIGYSSKDVLELSRFCINPLFYNKNLASYCLARFEKLISNDIKCLVAFSDPSVGHVGTIYEAANWKFVCETTPSYFYLKEDGWKLHKKTLYNHARSMHMTENYFAIKNGYQKVHTPPLRKYIKMRDNVCL